MARRFLTAEDVRRSTERVILIDDATVVTPQAMEVAEASGISLRNADGDPWSPQPPERGPDAQRSSPHPGLPEPEDNPDLESTAIVTAIGRNRAGVLAELTAVVAQMGCNVHDVSQKVVGGYFHIILSVEFAQGASFDEFKTRLECLGSPDDFVVRVMNERVFRFMHRV